MAKEVFTHPQVQKFGLVCDVSAASLTAMITLFYED